MNVFDKIPRLGVGINYQPEFRTLLDSTCEFVDFVEMSPDILCRENHNKTGQISFNAERLDMALSYGRKFPVIVHGLGLSIGSASGWNEDYIALLDCFSKLQSFHWHSEHLGFLQIQRSGGEPEHAGVQLPLPFTTEALELLIPRIEVLCTRYKIPFLIENTTFYLPDMPCDVGMDEIAFLNALTETTSCGLLLDLHNYYCNAVNFNFDPFEGLSRLNFEKVIEIHIAGGTIYSPGGIAQTRTPDPAKKAASTSQFLLDIHSDIVPEPVWELLEWVLSRAPNVSAIVYELLEQAHNIVDDDKIKQQLLRAKCVWNRHRGQSLKTSRRRADLVTA